MKVTEPKVDERSAQPTVGIRTQVPMSAMSDGLVPQLLGETFGWLAQRGIAPAGPPFMRFHSINMEELMDIELGVPVAQAVEGDERVRAGELPAGRYASLVYTGVTNGIPANKVLIDWAEEQGLAWDRFDAPGGDGFVSRYETFLTGPDESPDPADWDSEVAIKLAER